MGNVKKNYVLATIILLSCAFVLFTIYITDFKDGVRLGVTGVIAIVGVITTLCQLATWGFDRKVQKDEMGKKIATMSAKRSYHILTISLFVLWILDRIIFLRKNDFGNISLFAAFCLALVIFPIVQFFSSRRYR
ncbi:hypothetical protein PQ796_30735 (plasmid) [Priestia megaterium]|uniref:hypothetical protein n=1 Tax=Priestia TaxID=2800373 RepID=UPI0008E9DCE3|nr:hypothetical protein [Priestia megaterium]MBZ5482377.1 hypothetical protein [Bacillus sp. T_4]MDH2454855.1 hypothetical protein [Priestia megaterium]MDL5154311.1 hypothetical protein [Priestia megaterium]MED4287445.1 hypothetical protein [Priestia megaterium]MED4298881.1 hypothetical protein [Priestia megaterium]